MLLLVLGASYGSKSSFRLCLNIIKIDYKKFYHIIIMLKLEKVYIDSYYKVGGTPSKFTIDLPETVQLEENMLCQIHEVSIPHSWYSINSTNNNFIL